MGLHTLRRCLLLIALAFTPAAQAAAVDAVGIASALVDRLDRGEFEAATQPFSPEMRAAVGVDTLRAVWQSLPVQVGARTGRGPARVTTRDGTTVVVIPLQHAKSTLDAQVAVDDKGRIVGFLVRPAAPPPAPAASDANYTERDFRVGSGDRALPGTLALPATGATAHPAVVLVHGSGPNDRDETIGPNRPFLDLARGLAARGIATLRYDKRTHARPQDFASGDFDVDDETTRDAVAAVAALRATPGIDPGRVFVLGHSLGGMVAPRIASQSGHVAGLVLLAAPARPLLDVLTEQNRYLAGLDGTVSAEEQARLDALAAQIAAIRTQDTPNATGTPLGLPLRYWHMIEGVDAVADARAVAVPMLVIHGGRDVQVTAPDRERWQQAFIDDARVSLRFYPALNHLGIAGQGPGSLADYSTPGHVDTALIDDIAAWITKPATKLPPDPVAAGPRDR